MLENSKKNKEKRNTGTENRELVFEALLRLYNKSSCQNCGSKKMLLIHHIIPLSNGGKNILDNIAILCKSCHSKLHRKMYLGR